MKRFLLLISLLLLVSCKGAKLSDIDTIISPLIEKYGKPESIYIRV